MHFQPYGQQQDHDHRLPSYAGQSSIQTHIYTATSPTNTVPRTFVFLDGLGTASQGKTASHSKEVRSYLSREGYRKRKFQEARIYRSHSAPLGWQEAATGTNDSGEANPALLDMLLAAQDRKDMRRECKATQFSSPHLPGYQKSDASLKDPKHRFGARSLLTAIERDLVHFDPFATLPIALNRSDEVLAQLAVSLFLESPPTWASSKFAEAVGLHLAFLHKSVFCCMLATTSAYIDPVSGHGDSVRSIRWTAAGTFYVSQLISNPESRYGDDALVGILALLKTAILAGNVGNCHVHSRGFAQLLRHRGGLRSLQGSHNIDMFVSFLLVTPTSKGQISYLDHVQPDADGIAEIEDWVLDLDLLISTLRSLMQWDSPRSAKRAELCDELNDLMRKLTTRDEFDKPQQCFIALYLALIHWDYRRKPENYIDCLRELCQNFIPQTSLAEVSWILTQGLDDDRQRKWQALRMTKVLQRLKTDTAFRVKNFLCGLIRSSFDDVEVDMITRKDLLKISDEALAGLPIDAVEK
jgi:hypothetical protein